ncbi:MULTISPECIES: GDSL-type esterase/lipase family protein [unclassified Streptomyces]|uniref:GDSL-type esterase/lipase family protein n=1 Tax=unclassified Streptomyces TaxID=2593676 RepID=UPI00036ABD3D|nr:MULTISPECIES: GDSL-type esterase/lipase family protein [unclassified Streptomyces]MYT34337.1 SGNH/GDSL hydrolase family protein [Streptomyces sp. SID8354]
MNRNDNSPVWQSGWATAVQRPSEGFHKNWAEEGFADQTVRQTVRVAGAGTRARIRLSNRYGTAPLEVSGASIARAGDGAAVAPGSVRPLTFDGAESVRIPAGGEVVSDAAEVTVAALESLTVSLYFAGPTGPATFHAQAWATAYRAAGEQLGEADPAVFGETSVSWYYLAAVELADGGPVKPDTVVLFGDSIIDGFGSAIDADRRYSDALAERLAAEGRPLRVLNLGIGGNLLLNDAPYFGERAGARFGRDVLAQPGVRSVVVLVGLNDIGFSEVDLPTYKPNPDNSVEQLIAGYEELIAQAHAAGVRVVGGTITPFKGSEYHTPAAEAKRRAVNDWIRTGGAFDAVADFAAALADPAAPDALLPAYDCGDFKHPGDEGYRAMARATDPDAL